MKIIQTPIMMNNSLFVAVFLLLSTFLYSQQPDTAKNASDYEIGMFKATEAHNAGNLDEARATLQGLIKIADRFPATEPKGALVRSFLAVVESERGRFDNAEKYHVDAVNLARIAQPEGGPELTLCLLRQGEYYHSRGNKEDAAQRALEEVLKNQETLPAAFSARARWALADLLFKQKKWADAGRYAYFARQDVIAMFGEETTEQIKMLRLMIDASLKLKRGSYAKLMLDEYRAVLIGTDSVLQDTEYARLKADYETFAAAENEQNVVAARKRAGVLHALTNNPLSAGQVGYAITLPEQKLLDEKFKLADLTTTNGTKIKYGPHEVNDAALSMLVENGFLYKAVIGITLDSTNMSAEELHPALVQFTTLLFDPNEKSATEWLLKTVNSADSTLAFSNTYAANEKSLKVSRNRENNLLIVEFFPN